MSRIGKMPVTVPQGVKVAVTDGTIHVEGPKGKLSWATRPEVDVQVLDGHVSVSRKDDSPESRGFHGLYRQLVQNMVKGVSEGYSKTLLINGVGYRAELSGKALVLNLGYSNIIEYVIPEGITIAVDGPNKVVVSGIDKQKVGQVSAEIRSLRTPEPFKGKGIKYDTETIRRKAGKSGAKK
ncbi:50S ribosomal protein L6 [Parasphaerochaeta coccoides]|uniref:Large ribosomal subunit protein uL6 n=1 Tax=Parasphaerochaeta coccoides (strain ATCC BAA-1237 / DSM 17374 / SPN1) TaxID=760011 RepID=F4GKL6_PARC1|nr:50S ribosomal protein L6 [Parasphaerochaeta coccoides]AEC02899.1 LSU ribosomal protein L6P [Parasphaerochaeta coccoides DSM 17374]